MKIDLKNVKTCVFGIQGSGKTYLTANTLLKNFKNPFIYEVHPEDFRHVKRAMIFPYTKESLKIETLCRVCEQVKALGQQKKVDCFVLDEADLFIPNQSIPTELRDLVLNHRHYNLGMIFISRRPQSIPAEIVESSEYLFVFKIEGENVERKLEAIHPKFPELIKMLSKEKHTFILKKLGEEPEIYKKINMIEKSRSSD